MSDYLRREDVLENVLSQMEASNNMKAMSERILNLQEADVVERRVGEWVEVETGFVVGEKYDYSCSVCGNPPWWCGVDKEVLPNYCPNCGADMRGEN